MSSLRNFISDNKIFFISTSLICIFLAPLFVLEIENSDKAVTSFLDSSRYIAAIIAALYVAPFINIITAYRNLPPLYKPILKYEYSKKKIYIILAPYLFLFAISFLKTFFSYLSFYLFWLSLICIFSLIYNLFKIYLDNIIVVFNLRDFLKKYLKKHFKKQSNLFKKESEKFHKIVDTYKKQNNKEKHLFSPLYHLSIGKIKEKKLNNFFKNLPDNTSVIRCFTPSYKYIVHLNSQELPDDLEKKFRDCFEDADGHSLEGEIYKIYSNLPAYFIDWAKSNRSETIISEIEFVKRNIYEDFLDEVGKFYFYRMLVKIFENKEGCFNSYIKESFFSLWFSFFKKIKYKKVDHESRDNLFLSLYTSFKTDFWKDTYVNFKYIKGQIKTHLNSESNLTESFSKDYIRCMMIYYIKALIEKDQWKNSSHNPKMFIELSEDFIKFFKNKNLSFKQKILDHYYSKIFLLILFCKEEDLLEEAEVKRRLWTKLNRNDLLGNITKAYNISFNDRDLYDWDCLVNKRRVFSAKDELFLEFLKECLRTSWRLSLLNITCCDKSIIEILLKLKEELTKEPTNETNENNLVNLTSLIDRSKIMHELEEKIRDAFKEIPYEDLCVGITKDPQKKLQDHGNRLNNLGIKEEIRFFDTKAKDLFSAKQIKDYFLEKKCKKDELEKVEDEGEYIYVFAEPLKKKPSKFVNKLLTWAIIISAVYFTIKWLKKRFGQK